MTDIPKKRIYRRRADLPDRNQEPGAEVNKRQKKLGPRVSSAHLDMFQKASKNFRTAGAALEHAIELLAAEQGVPIDTISREELIEAAFDDLRSRLESMDFNELRSLVAEAQDNSQKAEPKEP